MFGTTGQPSQLLDWDQIVEADPDVLLVHPCGFDMARTLEEMPLLERRPGWRGLKAVQRDCIFVADGNQSFNRPGPSIVESLEMLAEIFHPELFAFRYEGKVGRATQHNDLGSRAPHPLDPIPHQASPNPRPALVDYRGAALGMGNFEPPT